MLKTKKTTQTTDAVAIMERMLGDDVETRRVVQEARTNVAVAQLIYDMRTKAGLTQTALAELIGTKQPVIARLEDADYQGHSLSMLQRIATVLSLRIEIKIAPLVPMETKRKSRRLVAQSAS